MKNNISSIHLELLDHKRIEVLEKLTPFTQDFVLGGGTALTLQLAHRQSFDFDFFSSSQISKRLLEKLSHALTIENVVIDNIDELTFFTTDNIKITFLYYPFQATFNHIRTEKDLRFFPIEGIALQKAYTVGRRGEYRDYFDLFSILKAKHTSLQNVIKQAKQIYGSIFDEKLFLEQLVYFNDMRNFEIIPIANTPIPSPIEVQQYFEGLVKTYLKSKE